MRKLVLYLVKGDNEGELGFIDIDDELTEDVKNDLIYEASLILREDGVDTNDFFRVTDESTGKKFDLGARFTPEFLRTADNDAIKVVIDASLGAFLRLAQGLKEGTYS